jgi:hypothetical protein
LGPRSAGQTKNAAPNSVTRYYYGTNSPTLSGATIAHGHCAWADAEALLDASGPPSTPPRSAAIRVASSIQDATAIAAIYTYSRIAPVPHVAIHVYRVQLVPCHIGPVALIDEMQNRLAAGRGGRV